MTFSTPASGVPPANTSPPTISGTSEVGQTLSAAPGSWNGDPPITFAYQWERCSGSVCTDIPGATAQTYAVMSQDAGFALQVRVKGSNAAGSSEAESAPTPPVGGLTATFVLAASSDDGDVERGSSVYPTPGNAPANLSTTGTTLLVRRSRTASGYQPIRVALLSFDTSSLPDSATITSAELRLNITMKSDSDARSLVAEWYPAANWPIDVGDWAFADSSTAHAGTPLSALTVGQQRAFALQNVASVDRIGVTALRLHISGSASAPTGPNDLGLASWDDAARPEPVLVVRYRTS